MEYKIKFDFVCINKRGLISGKSGEAEVSSEENPEGFRNNEYLISQIARDMATKTRQSIISVEITDVQEKA